MLVSKNSQLMANFKNVRIILRGILMYKIFGCIIFMQVTLIASDPSNLYQRRRGFLIAPLVIKKGGLFCGFAQRENDPDAWDYSYQEQSRKFFTIAENLAQSILFEKLDALAAKESFNQLKRKKTDLDTFNRSAQIQGIRVSFYENASLNCIDGLIQDFFDAEKKIKQTRIN